MAAAETVAPSRKARRETSAVLILPGAVPINTDLYEECNMCFTYVFLLLRGVWGKCSAVRCLMARKLLRDIHLLSNGRVDGHEFQKEIHRKFTEL